MQYQQPTYQNAYYAQPKAKSGKGKLLLIIGIPSILAVAALVTFLIIWLVFPSYDIDDYEDVYDACYEVFDVKLSRQDSGSMGSDGMMSYAYGSRYDEDYNLDVYWYEYASDEVAEKRYEELVEEYERQYDDIKKYDYYKNRDWESDDKLTKFYYGNGDDGNKIIIIVEDEFLLKLFVRGEAKDVKNLAEEFIEEID